MSKLHQSIGNTQAGHFQPKCLGFDKIKQMNFALKPKPPFDFNLTLGIYQKFENDLVDRFDGKTYKRVLLVDGKPYLTKTVSNGSIESPNLEVEVEPTSGTNVQNETKKKLRFMLGIDDDVAAFYKLAESDPVMSKLVKIFYGMRAPTTETVFESLVIAITEQQLALSIVITFRSRLVKQYGRTLTVGGETYYAFPAASDLAEARIEDIRSMKFSQKKSEAILNVSKLASEGKLDLEGMRNRSKDKILETLIEISGIGPWSANYVMVRGMRRGEGLMASDLAVRSAVTDFYQLKDKATVEDAEKILTPYKDYRSYAAYYLIRAYADQKYQEKLL